MEGEPVEGWQSEFIIITETLNGCYKLLINW